MTIRSRVVGLLLLAAAATAAAAGRTTGSPSTPSTPAHEPDAFPTPVAAHNAFVIAARAGTDASGVTVAPSVPGITYRTSFDPTDRGQDWACGFSVGVTRVLIRTDVDSSTGQHEVSDLAGMVARAF